MTRAMRVVIWDVDDVLNELMRAWLHERWTVEHPECVTRYSDLIANPPHEILNISQVEYLISLDAFREERFSTLVPRAEVLKWFSEHGHRCHHVALTATPQPTAHHSAGWVIKHFGEWVRTFAFVPAHRADSRRPTSKQEYLQWLGQGDVFVDDRDENVAAARSHGLSGVVMPQPWNASASTSIQATLQTLTALLS